MPAGRHPPRRKGQELIVHLGIAGNIPGVEIQLGAFFIYPGAVLEEGDGEQEFIGVDHLIRLRRDHHHSVPGIQILLEGDLQQIHLRSVLGILLAGAVSIFHGEEIFHHAALVLRKIDAGDVAETLRVHFLELKTAVTVVTVINLYLADRQAGKVEEI